MIGDIFVDRFSEKSLISLGEYYVYGLIDPRTKQIFYIGKGKKIEFLNMKKKLLPVLIVRN